VQADLTSSSTLKSCNIVVFKASNHCDTHLSDVFTFQ
jgi:hypothetical protein